MKQDSLMRAKCFFQCNHNFKYGISKTLKGLRHPIYAYLQRQFSVNYVNHHVKQINHEENEDKLYFQPF